MNITFAKEGKVEDFFQAISGGMIAQDTQGFYYQLQSGKLVESLDLKNWQETMEFEFGTINGVWKIYREEKPNKTVVKEEKDNQTQIREHALKLANSSVIKSFYSTLVAKRLKLSLTEVETELNQMVQEGLIQKKFELLCHNEHCLRVLDVKGNKEEFKSVYDCSFCGEEIEEVEEGFIKETYAGINK
jgi:hypothetical protein